MASSFASLQLSFIAGLSRQGFYFTQRTNPAIIFDVSLERVDVDRLFLGVDAKINHCNENREDEEYDEQEDDESGGDLLFLGLQQCWNGSV